MNRLLSVVLAGCLLVLSGCGRLSSEEKLAVNDAIESLSKIYAATEVGVNFKEYGSLVIEAKAKVNKASLVLKDIEIKNELERAMEGYADALTAWGEHVEFGTNMLILPEEPYNRLVKKYSLPVQGGGGFPSINRDISLNLIWAIAGKHLSKAMELTRR